MNHLIEQVTGSMEPRDRIFEEYHLLIEYLIVSDQCSQFNDYLDSKSESTPLEVIGSLKASVFLLQDAYSYDADNGIEN